MAEKNENNKDSKTGQVTQKKYLKNYHKTLTHPVVEVKVNRNLHCTLRGGNPKQFCVMRKEIFYLTFFTSELSVERISQKSF
jgi:hypothetical protein